MSNLYALEERYSKAVEALINYIVTSDEMIGLTSIFRKLGRTESSISNNIYI